MEKIDVIKNKTIQISTLIKNDFIYLFSFMFHLLNYIYFQDILDLYKNIISYRKD